MLGQMLMRLLPLGLSMIFIVSSSAVFPNLCSGEEASK
jgi:hypothetical protein